MHSAICPGSFDPPTNGHINIIRRGLQIFDELIVAVATNTSKHPWLTSDERVALLRTIFADEPRIRVDAFEGLLVNYARAQDVTTMLRGIRTNSDYEYESQMALANKAMHPELETIFMMTEGQFAYVSSSIIKDVIRFGGQVSEMIHPAVELKLREKMR